MTKRHRQPPTPNILQPRILRSQHPRHNCTRTRDQRLLSQRRLDPHIILAQKPILRLRERRLRAHGISSTLVRVLDIFFGRSRRRGRVGEQSTKHVVAFPQLDDAAGFEHAHGLPHGFGALACVRDCEARVLDEDEVELGVR